MAGYPHSLHQNQQPQQQYNFPLSTLLQAASQRELKEKELSNRLHVLEKLSTNHTEQLKKLKQEYSELATKKKNMSIHLEEDINQRNILENSLSNTQSSKMNLEQVYMTTKTELDLITKNNDDENKHQIEIIKTHTQDCKIIINNCHHLKSLIIQLEQIQTSGRNSEDPERN